MLLELARPLPPFPFRMIVLLSPLGDQLGIRSVYHDPFIQLSMSMLTYIKRRPLLMDTADAWTARKYNLR